MKTYLTFLRIELKLMLRDRVVLFFNYLFPLLFFFGSAALFDRRGMAVSHIVTMVLIVGILGNGLYSAGSRIVWQREMSVLRRFKVAPITPLPLLAASLVAGWLVYIPTAVIVVGLARLVFGLPLPAHPVALLLILSVGLLAFRAVGLAVAAVVNSPQESTMMVQIVYLPMLFLSGATFPLALLPEWTQRVAPFLPATYLVTGFQGVFARGETLLQNASAAAALLGTLAIGTAVAALLFRWEKHEKLPRRAKLWVVAVLAPFLLLGAYEASTGDQVRRSAEYWTDVRRDSPSTPARP